METPASPPEPRDTPRDAVHHPVQPPQPPEPAEPMTSGRLSRRLMGRMVAVLVVVGGLMFGLGIQALNRAFDAFEHQAAESALLRVQSVLQRDSQSLGEVLVDYAQWDETFHFVQDSNGHPDYLDGNFTVSSLRNLRIQAALIWDAQGRLLGLRALSGSTLADRWPTDLEGLSTALPSWGACPQPQRELVWSPQSVPLLVAYAPVKDTAGERSAGGCMALVRTLGADYARDLQSQVGVAFAIAPSAGPEVARGVQRTAGARWQALADLSPWAATLTVTVDESLDDERRAVVWGVVIGFAVLCAAGLAALYALLHALVIRRLSHFSTLADDYRRTHDWSITWPAKGRDEIDNLGHSLNELVRAVHWQVEYNATHDPLTGLLNRQGLERVLSELPYHAFEHRSRTSCLMLMDLDNFKVVNDGFGHDMGDALLMHVALQLTQAVRQGDIVARLGGDEFAVLLQNVRRDAVDGFSQRILDHLRQPFTRNDIQVATTASAGLAFCDGVHGPAELMRNADLAMYQAKQQGRDLFAHFNDALKVDIQRRNRLEQALRLAVASDGLQVVFQPVVDMVARQVVGMEALARWSIDGESVSPAEFIPIAEEAGLIGKLGMQVLDKSCEMVVRLRRRGVYVACSVNLSARQFEEANLVDELPRVVFGHGLPASAIRFEITESMVAQSDGALALAMNELSRLGFEFQLDDFGAGHSSLHRLQALPFQIIKIDRSFVVPLDRGNDVMVRTVKELASQLNLRLVAEGVETEVQLKHLLDLGIQRIQGYLVARPMSDAALLHWLSTAPYTCHLDANPPPASSVRPG